MTCADSDIRDALDDVPRLKDRSFAGRLSADNFPLGDEAVITWRAPSFQAVETTGHLKASNQGVSCRNRYLQVGNSFAATNGTGSSVGNVAGKGHLFVAARIAKQTATLLVNVRTRPLSYRANCCKGDP